MKVRQTSEGFTCLECDASVTPANYTCDRCGADLDGRNLSNEDVLLITLLDTDTLAFIKRQQELRHASMRAAG